MVSINGRAASVLDVLACVIISKTKTFISLGYNSRRVLRGFRYINIKKVISISNKKEIPNEFGSVLDIKDLNINLTLNIRGRTKGKGFAGVMKRYGFSGLNASHGVSLAHRSLGTIGSRQDPGRVWKGKKMAGKMGNTYIHLKLIKIAIINKFIGRIVVYGPLPGGPNSILHIQQQYY
ncbi:50S ribosomal subunit protein L3 [Candidatus Hodgkinia cicadicola]|uniref:50S ribosomal protein L3 n=1 Tax=Candidatus Hodgkinia cicadicola TaxID=573658 RepID=A0ABX4MHG3_9HYPH|nr:50S ribosomal subunit protein L3 [Candidatus Hodgkinia cicadicola]